jgi:CDP-diacylglycerol--serine O-phosphatidyltransferase
MRIRILRQTAILPAGFTLLNGLAGFGAIHFAAKGGLGISLDAPGEMFNLKASALLIFLAMICDMLDGRLARFTRTTSDFGSQLDSLCDVISFGVAPAVLVLRATISILRSQIEYVNVERVVWCIAALYVLCAVLRLARFNVETDLDESFHMEFRGLPSPAAAACLAAMVLLFARLTDKDWAILPTHRLLVGMSFTLPILTAATALLMVTRFRYPHLVNQYVRGKRPFHHLIRLMVLLLAAVLEPFVTLAVGTLLYVLSGPVRTAWLTLRRKSK